MGEAVAYQSFAVMSGEQLKLNFTVTDRNDAAVDLSGGSGRFAMARSPDDSSSLVIDSDASPATATITVTDAASGSVNVVVTDEDTEGLSGDYYWEFKWTSAGAEATVARGWLSVNTNLI